jgi:uncharacterized protein
MDKKNKDRTLEIITHLIGIFSYIIGPLIIFVLTKDKEVKRHSKNAINWQASLIIYSIMILIISMIFSLIASFLLERWVFYHFGILFSIINILNIIFCIIAAFKASEGKYWKYPGAIDIIGTIGEKEFEEGRREVRKAYKEVKRDIKKELSPKNKKDKRR